MSLSGDDFANFSAVFALFSAFLSHLSGSAEPSQPPCPYSVPVAAAEPGGAVLVPLEGERSCAVVMQPPAVPLTHNRPHHTPRRVAMVLRPSVGHTLGSGDSGAQPRRFVLGERCLGIFQEDHSVVSPRHPRGGLYCLPSADGDVDARTLVQHMYPTDRERSCALSGHDGENGTVSDATEKGGRAVKSLEGDADRRKTCVFPAAKRKGGGSDTESPRSPVRRRFKSSSTRNSRERRTVASPLFPGPRAGSARLAWKQLQLPSTVIGIAPRESTAVGLPAEPERPTQSVESVGCTELLPVEECEDVESPDDIKVERTAATEPEKSADWADCRNHDKEENERTRDSCLTRAGAGDTAESNRVCPQSTSHALYQRGRGQPADCYEGGNLRCGGELRDNDFLRGRFPGARVSPCGAFRPSATEFELRHKERKHAPEQAPLCDYVWDVLAGVEGAVEMRVRVECVQVQVVSVRLTVEDLSTTLLQG